MRVESLVVAESIVVLRGTIVRTIRIPTADADRRMQVRVAVDQACTVIVAGVQQPGHLVDLSHSGAHVKMQVEITSGSRGTLVLGRPDSNAKAVEVSPDGSMGLALDEGSVSDAMAAALERFGAGGGRKVA